MKAVASLAFLGSLAFAASALAADGAKFRPVGFSADGGYFAFQQYGVQDGSGFPYADLFVLDTAADKWAPGTPKRILIEDEQSGLRQALKQADEAMAGLALRYKITEPAEILAANPFTEVVADRSRLRFHNHYNHSMGVLGTPDGQGTYDLKVSTVKLPTPETCASEEPPAGFKLELVNNKSKATLTLHQDSELPASRGCPIAYDIEAVLQPAHGESAGLVAVIGVSSIGFEGADRRFLAIPFHLTE